MEKVLFKEEQRFTQKWMWVIFVFILLSVIIPLASTIVEEPLESNSPEILRLILYGGIAVLFLAITMIVMVFTRLKTKITYDGIFVAYPPLARKWKKITAPEIEKYVLRQYRARSEYGGYGMRKRRKAGQAFTISGNVGLQLYFKDGKKLLIGTQKKQAIEHAMGKLLGDAKKVAPHEASRHEGVFRLHVSKKVKKILIIGVIEIIIAIIIFIIIQIFK